MLDINEYAYFKRLLEYYSADNNIRNQMDSGQFTAQDAATLHLDISDIHKAFIAIRAILFGNKGQNVSDNPYYQEYVRVNQAIIKRVSDSVSADAFATKDLHEYSLLTSRRCGMEKEVIRQHPNIYYFPLCIEISDGCKVQCDFCGFEAEHFKSYFEYNEDNRLLWRNILAASRDIIGDVARTAPYYFATEPLDNPDYVSFLKDAYELLGDIPQTTTALAESHPDRIREIIKLSRQISGEDYLYKAHLRFSIRNLNQLRKIFELYSPLELVNVELLANNKESVNRYSNSGRVKNRLDVNNNKKSNYSISCIAGVKVNMVTGIMEFIEPVVPSLEHPKGYRIRESIEFTNIKDYTEGLRLLYNKYAIFKLPYDIPLEFNNNVKLVNMDNKIAFLGDNTGIVFANNYVLSEAINMINAGKCVNDIISSMGLFGSSKDVLTNQLDRMFNNGYIVRAL